MTPDEALDRLRHGSSEERRAALRALGDTADAQVTPAVASMLQAKDEELVELAEATLWRIWARSGDAAVDALFADGMRAMAAQDWLGAVTAFGGVIEAAPGFAEGWNKRATARYLASHYASAIVDCEETVRLNPHHFGALAGQGLCHQALGQTWDAARCFRRALAIHPRLESVRQQLARAEALLARGNGHALGSPPADARGVA